MQAIEYEYDLRRAREAGLIPPQPEPAPRTDHAGFYRKEWEYPAEPNHPFDEEAYQEDMWEAPASVQPSLPH